MDIYTAVPIKIEKRKFFKSLNDKIIAPKESPTGKTSSGSEKFTPLMQNTTKSPIKE